jgi:uncharacterized protein
VLRPESPGSSSSPDPSTSDLGAVIRRLEAKNRIRQPPGRAASVEDALGGTVEENDAGRVLVVRRQFHLEHRHGEHPLRSAREIEPMTLGLLARGDAALRDGPRLLFLDTETTGLAGGTGTYAFLVGVGFFDGDGFEVRQYFMRDLDEEPALLATLDALFRDFDGIVTYNGTGFDLPLLETRFVLARRRWSDDRLHLDLLRTARRLWSTRFCDCRLGTLEHHVLRFAREDDLPGFMIPNAYFEYLRRKRPGALPRVFEHNRHDVLSLAVLTGWLAAAVARAPEGERHPEELVGLGRLWEGIDLERGVACYRKALDGGLESPVRERVLLRLARREKKLARWEEARTLCEAATRTTRGFDPEAWEEIAKIHEHRRRDFAAARAVVEEALSKARVHLAPERVLGSFEHRLARLHRRERQVARCASEEA